MQRGALILAVLGAIFGAALFVHSMDSSDPIYSSDPVDSRPTVADREIAVPEAQPSEIEPIEQGAEHGEAFASESVARWINEANGDDTSKCAAAIEALGTAPKSLALPVLQKVLSTGADGDRQLALNSLRTLALEQGDADSIIRDTLRLAVYDGDDYVVAETQAVLEEIEYSLDEVASNRDQ